MVGVYGLEVEEHSYAYHTEWHEGFESDGSLDVLEAKAFYGDDAVPLIDLGDGKVISYPEAMKILKERKRAAST